MDEGIIASARQRHLRTAAGYPRLWAKAARYYQELFIPPNERVLHLARDGRDRGWPKAMRQRGKAPACRSQRILPLQHGGAAETVRRMQADRDLEQFVGLIVVLADEFQGMGVRRRPEGLRERGRYAHGANGLAISLTTRPLAWQIRSHTSARWSSSIARRMRVPISCGT